MDKELIIILLLGGFLVYKLYWVITDPRPKNEIKSYILGKQAILFAIFAFIFLALNILSSLYFSWPETSFSVFFEYTGIGVFVLGLVIAVWAKKTMKSSWGVPDQHDIKRQKEIVDDGPFKFTRNPIYVGTILMFLGFSIALQSVFVFLVLIVCYYFDYSAKNEEKYLQKYFGSNYTRYKSKVPRWI